MNCRSAPLRCLIAVLQSSVNQGFLTFFDFEGVVGLEQSRCVNLQCWGVLLVWMIVGQGPIALAVGAGGGVWTFFLSSIFSLFFLPLFGRRPDID